MRISLIHVGDIHYPDNKTAQAADCKDAGLSKDLIAELAPFRLKRAMDTLIRTIENSEHIEGLLFSGDLTSQADMAGYEECVAYLEAGLSTSDIWTASQIHVVHGNHDVDREADTSTDAQARYRPTENSWTTRKLPVLRADEVRSVDIKTGKASVWVHSMNSCVGCGDIRRLPAKVRIEIGELLKGLGSSPILKEDFDLIGEQLDTPAFNASHVQELTNRVQSARESVHVLLGHHPILPQALPRLEIYTEVINGGMVRSALTEMSSHVIYCHGHVHDDPVEIVRDADDGTDVVFISAPLFVDGFNLLTIHYALDRRSTQNAALPLGCEVIRYRTTRSGGVNPEPPLRIPLCSLESYDYVSDDVHRAVLANLTSEPVRFRPLLAETRKVSGSIQEARFVEHLTQLDWFRLVDITARDEEPDHWQIRRIGG